MYATSGNNAVKNYDHPYMRSCSGDVRYGICGSQSKSHKAKVIPVGKTKRIKIRKEHQQMIAASERAIQNKYARRRLMNTAAVIMLICATALAFTGVLSRYGKILVMNYSNVRIEREIRQINIETGNIREEFVKAVDPVKLRETAINELGMREPAASQKLLVSIPNGDRIVLGGGSAEETSNTNETDKLFDNLEGFFKTMR